LVPGCNPSSTDAGLTATDAPIGHGHVYAPAHYIDAWMQVTDVRGWPPQEIMRLKHHLSKP
jgi:uncharacterized membrane protein